MGFYIPSSKVSGSRSHLINVVNADAQMSKAYSHYCKAKFLFLMSQRLMPPHLLLKHYDEV